ncbi:MAG: hypothetical protein ACYDDC_02340, partial [Thermoplasmataceae archaeon]
MEKISGTVRRLIPEQNTRVMGKKIFVESYGCTLSKSETGLYVNKMLNEGGELVDSPDQADLSIIGTCVVIKHTEEKML